MHAKNEETPFRSVDALVFILFLIFFCFLRYSTLPMIDVGGDAPAKWFEVKKAILGYGDWHWDHQSARFTQNLFIYLFQSLLGVSTSIYYLPTLTVAALQLFLLYSLGLLLQGRFVAVLSCLFLMLFTPMSEASTQILPAVYSSTCVLAALLFLLLSLRRPERELLFLPLSALALFFAYGAKVQSLFVLPAFVTVLWHYSGRRKQALCALLIPLAAFFLLETAFYMLFTDFSLGRLDVLRSSYGYSGKLELIEIPGVMALFNRYTLLYGSWGNVFFVFLLGFVIILSNRKFFSHELKAVLACVLSFLFCMTFALKDLSPPVPLIAFHRRYLLEIYPLLFLLIFSVLYFLIVKLPSRNARISFLCLVLLVFLHFFTFLDLSGTALYFALCISLFAFAYLLLRPSQGSRALLPACSILLACLSLELFYRFMPTAPDHALKRLQEYDEVVHRASGEGIPVLSQDHSLKALRIFYFEHFLEPGPGPLFHVEPLQVAGQQFFLLLFRGESLENTLSKLNGPVLFVSADRAKGRKFKDFHMEISSAQELFSPPAAQRKKSPENLAG